MSEENISKQELHELPEPHEHRVPWATIVLGTGLALSLGAALYLHTSLVNVRMETATLEKEVASLRQSVNNTDMTVSQSIGNLRTELDSTRKETVSTVEQTKVAARRQAEAIASRMTNKLAEKQAEQQKVFTDQLDQIKTRAELATARLTDVTSEVTTVKTAVASNRADLDKTISDLHRTTGDLGVMSGLIATNGKELAALRELGERDYFEFNLKKGAGVQKVGDIMVALKKSDAKRNRFTVEIVADDKRVEKKDRTINEPVQFYVVSKARIPYELVVNEVRKDVVVGYLATPKVKTPARRL